MIAFSTRSFLAALGFVALTSSAFAQSFNIDCGDATGTAGVSAGIPANTYGAAAAQPGFWNAASFATNFAINVKDLAGNPTTINTSVTSIGNSVGNFYFNNAVTSGDDEKLLDDLQDIGNGGVASETTWTFSGVANGCYDIYIYSWAPDNSAYVGFVQDPNGTPTTGTIVGGSWGGTHVLGVTYAKFFVNVTTGSFAIRVTSNNVNGNFASINGFQLVANSPACQTGQGFCFGDGTGAACPCANNGGAGRGCANSVDPTGAFLTATGNASVANDTVILQGSGMPNSTCLYFQGTTQIATTFGDGLRCAGGSVIRLGTKVNAASASQYPTGADPKVSVKGLVPAVGGTRTYQAWYRNAAAFCTASTFNLSNGLSIVWNP